MRYEFFREVPARQAPFPHVVGRTPKGLRFSSSPRRSLFLLASRYTLVQVVATDNTGGEKAKAMWSLMRKNGIHAGFTSMVRRAFLAKGKRRQSQLIKGVPLSRSQ